MEHPESYIKGNKEAWEEAFEQRRADWGTDILPRLQKERFPFLSPEMRAEVELIPWAGKTVGQFCCNNGRELLSIMKQGAQEGIGFDIAENQVEFANRSAQVLHLNCRFVATNILEIDESYDDRFDFVLITIGSLTWFENLSLFFEKVARCVKEGGGVLINDMHPVTNMLALPGEDNYDANAPARFVNPYFQKTWVENNGIFYITGKRYASKTFTSYSHPLSAVFMAAIGSGLQIISFQEFERDCSGGEFSVLEHQGIPLSYILKLKKPSKSHT